MKEAADLEQIESEIENRVNSLLEQLQNYPIDEMQERMTHWRTRIAVVEQALGESKLRQEERAKSSADAKGKSVGINTNIQSLIANHDRIKEEINELKVSITEIASQIESKGNLISPLENSLERTEQELTEMLSLESKERLVSNQTDFVSDLI